MQTGIVGPGFAHWTCPVDGCSWRMRVEPVSSERYVLKELTPQGISEGINEAARRRAAELDRDLRTHAESHDVLDYLRTIGRLNQDLAQVDSGIRPHRYSEKPPGGF